MILDVSGAKELCYIQNADETGWSILAIGVGSMLRTMKNHKKPTHGYH